MKTNQEKVAYIFAAIDRAGISISDVVRVVRVYGTTAVSRTALHHWKKGGNVGDELRLNLMVRISQSLNIACDAKQLPLQNRLSEKERVDLLRKIIANAATKRVE